MVRCLILFFLFYGLSPLLAQKGPTITSQPAFENIWTKPPTHIPNNVSIDAPLMGNGDVTMSVGYKENRLRYYLSKNDFWRLRSKADGLSGPRMVGFTSCLLRFLVRREFGLSIFRNGTNI